MERKSGEFKTKYTSYNVTDASYNVTNASYNVTNASYNVEDAYSKQKFTIFNSNTSYHKALETSQ